MKGKERRDFQRICIDAVSQFLVATNGIPGSDFEGIIENVSESGIGIQIGKESYGQIAEDIVVGDEFFFQGMDSYTLYKEYTSDVFQGRAKIVRIVPTINGYYMGCAIVSDNSDLQEYIKRRKIAYFLDGINCAKECVANK